MCRCCQTANHTCSLDASFVEIRPTLILHTCGRWFGHRFRQNEETGTRLPKSKKGKNVYFFKECKKTTFE